MKNNETRTREQIAADIMGFFEDNESAFIECIEDIDSYNGYLGDDRYCEMEMIDEFFSGDEATEILRRAYYGYDADTWNTDSRGEKEHGAFNPNREYFHFNGYGNLISSDYKDYSGFNDIYLVQALSENRKHIDSIDRYDELSELFDEYENTGE